MGFYPVYDLSNAISNLLKADGVVVRFGRTTDGGYLAEISDAYVKQGVKLSGAVGFGCCPSEAFQKLIDLISGKTLVFEPITDENRRELTILLV